MKKIQTVLIAVVALALFACGGNSEKKETKENQEEQLSYEGMKLVDLTTNNIPAEIYVPKKQDRAPELLETPHGGTELVLGKNFAMEIVPFGMSKAEKKKELENDMVYTIEYLEEDEQMMLYKKSIGDSGIDPEFHFFYEITIDGDPYSIKSIAGEAFNEASAKKMLKSAKSMKGKAIS